MNNFPETKEKEKTTGNKEKNQNGEKRGVSMNTVDGNKTLEQEGKFFRNGGGFF